MFNLFLNTDFLFSHQVLQIQNQFFRKPTFHRVYTFTEFTIWFGLARQEPKLETRAVKLPCT